MEFKPAYLVVEDNLIDQLVITQLLKKVLDITQIHITNNGKEGIHWLVKNQKNPPPLIILLDIQMPIMNGFDFLDEFHKLSDSFKKEIQIYILSSTLDSDEITKITTNQYVSGFLSKPLSIPALKNKIKEVTFYSKTRFTCENALS